MEKQFPAFLGAQLLTPLRKSYICPFGWRGPRRCDRSGGTVRPVAGGRKRKETATPEPETAAAPKGPKTAG